MNNSNTSLMVGKITCNVKKLLMTFLAAFALISGYAANISSNAVTGNWNAGGSWVGGVAPGAGDNVTIVNGAVITVSVNASCASITINSTGLLKRSLGNLTVNGNFTNNGTFDFSAGANGLVTMAGSSAAIIGGSKPTTFVNLLINNSGGVTLGQPTTVTGILTLTAGVLTTTSTNLLRVTNSAVAAIVATTTWSTTCMINGPVKRALLASGTNIYNFPVGAGSTYLPLVLNSTNTTANDSATVTGFASGSGGSGLSVSTTEYWSMTTDLPLSTGSTVSISRPTAISPYNLIGKSTSAGGAYVSLTGTVGTFGITGSNDIGTASPWFFAFAYIPSTITTSAISGSPFCVGTTPVSVPFTYNPAANFPSGGSCTFTAQLSDASGSFATPTNLQSVVSDASGSQSISVTIPSVSTGAGYRIRVISNAPSVSGTDNGSNLTINTLPSAPTTTGASRCGTGTVSLSATGSGGTLKFYSDAGLTTLVNTGSPYTTPSIGITTTYYVTETSVAGCVSPSSTVVATVNTIPSAPITTGGNRCGTGTVSLSASGSGGTLKFYSDAGLTTLVNTGSPFTTPSISTTTTYYVTETSVPGCISSFSTVVATVNTVPSAPATTGGIRCGTGTVSLSATGSGGTLRFYSDAGLTTLVNTGSPYITPSISSTTAYYVTETSGAGCISGYTTVTATVNTAPTVTTSAANSISATAATLNGTINANSVTTNNYFNWATDAFYTGNGSTYNNLNVPASPVTSTGAGNTAVSLALSGLTPNTKYHFQAYGNNGTCTIGGIDANFTTLPDAPVVGMPNNAYSAGFTANWTAPAIPGTAVYTYTVQASTDPAFGSVNATGTLIPAGTLSYVFTTLSTNTTYYFRVMVVNASGNSVWSGVSSSITTTTYNDYYNTGNIAGNLTTSWTTSSTGVGGTLLSAGSNNFTSGDVFHIRAGTTVTTTANWTISGSGCKLDINGTLTLSNSFGINGTFSNNGTFNNGGQTVTFGTGGDVTGTNATTFCNLTISTTNATDVVTLTKSGAIIKYNGGGGILTLTKGIFKIGAGNIISFDNNSATNGLTNNGGDIATTGTNGADGGKIILLNGSGANFNITGAGVTHIYDISFGTAVSAGNRQVVQSTANTVVINGTLTMPDNQSKWATNAPAYGTNATLYINNNGQGYTPGTGSRLEWLAMASGTIGTTAGYPNNVTLVNVGTSVTNGCGFAPSGTWAINGTLSIGDGTVACFATLESMTAFTCGGITIDNGSTLKHATATFTVKGNWRQQGATIGIFTPTTVSSSSAVIFGGSGTSVSPQIISTSSGTITFGNGTNSSGVTINNGTYVKLASPVSLAAANILTLTSGILETDATNILSITNTAVTGITGTGSSTTFINGPVKWSIALASKYTFPLGKGTTYLPFDLTPGVAAANTVTAEAFNLNSGGTPDGVTVTSISNTEYWSLSATSNFSSGANISAGRISGIGSFNMLAKSTTVNGIYSGIGGNTGTVGSISGIVNGAVTGMPAPWFIALAYGPLNINVTSITYPSCTGSTGTVTVAGSGGIPPYTYNINGGGYQASGTFAGLVAGTYTLGVKDNVNSTRSISVVMDVLVITTDTGTCVGSSVQLQANTSGAWSYNWSPATGLNSTTIANPVANPATTTTYTASAIVVDNTTNLISNPGFESGNTGFVSGYDYDIYSASYGGYASSWSPPTNANGNGAWPSNHNGIYLITGNSLSHCSNFANFNARTGSKMMTIDGPNSATYTTAPYPAWSQTVSGLTIGTYYVFSYWVTNAFTSIDASAPVIRTKINSTSVTGTATYPNPYTVSALNPSWIQMSYLWQATSTTATIEMFDEKVSDGSNDFAIDDLSFYITCNPSKSVTVTITPTPTLNVVTQPTQACMGQGASIAFTGLTASSTFTVNYTINGIVQIPVTGITSDASGNATFTTVALAAANNGQTLEITSLTNTAGHSNCTQIFTGKTVTLAVNPNVTWLGSGTTDWNTASNWCGGIPAATTNVSIPDYGAGGIYPVISTGISAYSNNITISTNASVIINNSGTLTISGLFSNSGTFTNDGELIFNSSTLAQSFPGATGTITAMNNFTINNTSGLGVTFNRNFSIYGTLTPTAGNIEVNNALVTLTSTATTTARVGAVGSTFSYTGTGKFAVERYYPARRSWRLATVPLYQTGTIFDEWQLGGAAYSVANTGRGLLVTGPGATSPIGANGLDISQQQNISLKVGASLSPVSNTRVPLSKNIGTSADNLGYFLFVRGDRDPINTIIPNSNITTISCTGKLQTGPQVFTASSVAGGFELIGNPYASPVNFQTLTRSNLLNRFVVWDPYLNASLGGYVYLDYNTGTGAYDRSVIGPGSQDSLIQSGQAFFIQTNTAGPASITFSESNKVAQNNRKMFRPVAPAANMSRQESLRTNLYLLDKDNSTTLADGNLVRFDKQFSDNVTIEDVPKSSNISETFGLQRNGRLLSIEKRPLINKDDTLFFRLTKTVKRKYRFEFIPEKLAHYNLVGFLEDNFLHSATVLNMSSVTLVDFDITDDPLSSLPDRFRIVFRPIKKYPVIKAYLLQNDIVVEWKAEEETGINHYEIEKSVDGVSFLNTGILLPQAGGKADINYKWLDINPAPDEYYYRIKDISINGTTKYSDVVKISMQKEGLASINVFPNPIVGGVINLRMNNLPAGIYTARLLNSTGQVMLSKKINHAGGSSVEVIRQDEASARSVYQLEVTGPGNFQAKIKVMN